MTQVIDRRGLLRIALGGATAAAIGLSLMPDTAESAPLMVGAGRAMEPEYPIEEAARVCWWRYGRRVCRWRPVRRRCWWRYGRRVCRYW